MRKIAKIKRELNKGKDVWLYLKKEFGTPTFVGSRKICLTGYTKQGFVGWTVEGTRPMKEPIWSIEKFYTLLDNK